MAGRGRLSVRTARDGDRVLVEMGDNGPGIPEGAAPHILEPVYTTKRVGGGTGLDWTSAGALSSSATTATCASLQPRRHPLPGAAATLQNG